ncbi:hypothetical protein V1525DRAFT_396808 [Lipomyces kononenkoae]|uniref:Uncharacterized protein n=1 Tax=Lipomyces kononenkoae TaxID=34357 RepID=A0ACC3T772_LIPKO
MSMWTGNAAVVSAKRKLRQKIAKRLQEVTDESIISQSSKIAHQVRILPEYQRARKIGIYLHLDVPDTIRRGNGRIVEVRTDLLMRNMFEDDKYVFLPRVVPTTTLSPNQLQLLQLAQRRLRTTREARYLPFLSISMLHMPDIESVESLVIEDAKANSFTVKEPTEAEDAFDVGGLDLVIVPGLGFSKSCARLGHGKGFYDNFIRLHRMWSEYNDLPRPAMIGVSFEEQLIQPTVLEDFIELPTEDHDEILDAVIVGDEIYRSSRSRGRRD